MPIRWWTKHVSKQSFPWLGCLAAGIVSDRGILPCHALASDLFVLAFSTQDRPCGCRPGCPPRPRTICNGARHEEAGLSCCRLAGGNSCRSGSGKHNDGMRSTIGPEQQHCPPSSNAALRAATLQGPGQTVVSFASGRVWPMLEVIPGLYNHAPVTIPRHAQKPPHQVSPPHRRGWLAAGALRLQCPRASGCHSIYNGKPINEQTLYRAILETQPHNLLCLHAHVASCGRVT